MHSTAPTYRTPKARRSTARKAAAAVATGAAMWLIGAGSPPLAPQAGMREYQAPAFVSVPDGRVNVAGGNFVHERTDLEIDTRLGTTTVGAVYNSVPGWLWNFDITYLSNTFTDQSGAQFGTLGYANGQPIPGTLPGGSSDDPKFWVF